MLSDPLTVTFGGSAKTLVRTGTSAAGSTYRTADGEFEVSISSSPAASGKTRVEVLLTRNYPDATPDPFGGGPATMPNTFGVIYETNPHRFFSESEIPLLRAALLAFLGASSTEARIMAGEK